MLGFEAALDTRIWFAKERIKDTVRDFIYDEQGDTNMISIIIVLVIVLVLAAAFWKNIQSFVNGLWSQINSSEAELQDFNIDAGGN